MPGLIGGPYQNFDPATDPYLKRYAGTKPPTPGEATDFWKGMGAGMLGLPADMLSIMSAIGQKKLGMQGIDIPAGKIPFTTERIGQMLNANTQSPAFRVGEIGAPDLKDLVKLAGSSKLAMTLFHGTPHRFDKFDMSKIGTGEGAQAYGHGLYFAQNPGVAKSYQSGLSKPTLQVGRNELAPALMKERDELAKKLSGIDTSDFAKDNSDLLGDFLAGGGFSPKTLENSESIVIKNKIKSLDEILSSPANVSDAELARKMADAGVGNGIINQGHLYEVDIPDEITNKMLDWDAPLADLPQEARAVLGVTDNLGQREREAIWEEVTLLANNDEKIYKAWTDGEGEFTEHGVDILNRLVDGKLTAKDKTEINGLFREYFKDYKEDYGGNNFLEALERRYSKTIGDAIKDAEQFASPEKVSESLRSLGIPGIRYYDGGSRAGKEGTRNIVVFDPNTIRQVKRDGELVYENKLGL